MKAKTKKVSFELTSQECEILRSLFADSALFFESRRNFDKMAKVVNKVLKSLQFAFPSNEESLPFFRLGHYTRPKKNTGRESK